MQYVTLGDSVHKLNVDGHFENVTTQPHHVGVTVEFDHRRKFCSQRFPYEI